MSGQFDFEEEYAQDWLKDSSQWTQKPPLTFQDVSAGSSFLQGLLDLNIGKHTKSITHQKDRKKNNSKQYRDRKRHEQEALKKQLETLTLQNKSLKESRTCRWCGKAPKPSFVCSASKKIDDQEIGFLKPQFFSKVRAQKSSKVWIAVGLLMLVLGLTMWGFQGDKQMITKIQLEKEQLKQWSKQMKEENDDDYLQVKMHFKSERSIKKQMQDFRIGFRDRSEKEPEGENEEISIRKDLLYSIHAQLEDIGLYI